MLALIRMDWTQNRRVIYYMLPLWAMYAGMVFHPDLAARILVGLMFAGAFSLQVMIQNHTRPIDDWLCALPVSRSQIVLARYASTALAILIGLLIPVVIMMLMNALKLRFWAHVLMEEYLIGLSVDGSFLLIFALLFLPLYFRFGVDKGIGILGAFVVLVAGLLFWRWGYEGLMQRFIDLLTRLMDDGAFRGWILMGMVVLAGVSIALSLWAYPRRTYKSH